MPLISSCHSSRLRADNAIKERQTLGRLTPRGGQRKPGGMKEEEEQKILFSNNSVALV